MKPVFRKVRALPSLGLLTLAFAATTPVDVACANAGLTSAGVDQNTNTPQPEEPTLAQVAPVPGTPNGASGTTAPATNAAGGTVVVSGTNAPAAGTDAASGRTGATPAVPKPPPPVDPATLPVSVIHPLNQPEPPAEKSPPAAAPEDAGAAPVAQAKPALESARPQTTARTAPPPMAPARPMSKPASNPEFAAKASAPPSEKVPDAATDNGSSSFIFYTGSGIAGAILLLTLAGFVRRRGEEPFA